MTRPASRPGWGRLWSHLTRESSSIGAAIDPAIETSSGPYIRVAEIKAAAMVGAAGKTGMIRQLAEGEPTVECAMRAAVSRLK